MQAQPATRSYRCTYWPKDQHGHAFEADTGVLPAITVKADDAEGAIRAAHYITGCPVAQVERLDSEVVQ